MIVDVHAHLVPEGAWSRVPAGMRTVPFGAGGAFSLVADGDRELGRPIPPEMRALAAFEARHRTDRVDVSLVAPWLDVVNLPLDPDVQRAWCRVIDEEFAELLRDEPSARYLAALPDLDGAAAADELEWAAAHGAVGAALAANPHDDGLGRADYDALWSAAERLRMPIVLHPSTAEIPVRLQRDLASVLVANPFETTLAAYALIAGGVLDRFPELEIVLVHGGGFLPYQYGRMLTGLERILGRRPSASAREVIARFSYDTVLFEPEPLRYLLDLVGVDRVMAGSDCPFPMTDAVPYGEEADVLGLSATELSALRGGTAARLFRLDPPPGDAGEPKVG